MKKALILGAGLVARPLVNYLFDLRDVEVSVGDQFEEKARALVLDRPRGRAFGIDLRDEEALRREIGRADIVISMVPYGFHPVVAKHCLALKKNLVTASYVSDAMLGFDAEAKRAGLIFLNETGLDPGIDHMEAMRVIDEIRAAGGQILSFVSWCGGLPAPEDNDNPFGYKFSWSPLGVLLASKNPAQYRRDGKDVIVPAEKLFSRPDLITIEGLTEFEGYPNRNSLQYIDIYGIPETKTMLRGTLRYKGWCSTMAKMIALGLLSQDERNLTGLTYKGFLEKIVEEPAAREGKLSSFGGVDAIDAEILPKLKWLGLLSDDPLPISKGSALDVVSRRMIDKMSYAEGERDLIVLQHRFIAAFPDSGGKKEDISSTLIDFGIRGGDSAMSRTVGLPAAVAARMILEGRIKEKGVQTPVKPGIYNPILEELEKQGITFREKRRPV